MTSSPSVSSIHPHQTGGSREFERNLRLIRPNPDGEPEPLRPMKGRITKHTDYTFEIAVGVLGVLAVSVVAGGIHLINSRLRK